ncbi:hypothetical protein [Chryseobacterium lineare]
MVGEALAGNNTLAAFLPGYFKIFYWKIYDRMFGIISNFKIGDWLCQEFGIG